MLRCYYCEAPAARRPGGDPPACGACAPAPPPPPAPTPRLVLITPTPPDPQAWPPTPGWRYRAVGEEREWQWLRVDHPKAANRTHPYTPWQANNTDLAWLRNFKWEIVGPATELDRAALNALYHYPEPALDEPCHRCGCRFGTHSQGVDGPCTKCGGGKCPHFVESGLP